MDPERQHTPAKHSTTVGGSSAGRILACPASLELVKKMPKESESAYAAEGSALHDCIAHCLIEGLSPGESTATQIGKEFYGITITAEHIHECIDPALRQFDQILDKLEEDGPVTYKLEQEVKFPGIPDSFGTPGIPDSFGTLDIIAASPKRVVILDWKFGGGVAVSATENTQMKYYATAAAETFPEMFFPNSPEVGYAKDVLIVIVQPRIHPEYPETWNTTFIELSQFKQQLVEAYDEAIGDEPHYHRGDHCRWCAAMPICPLYKDVAQKLADMQDNGGMPGTAPDDTNFSQDDLAEWMKTADIVMAWAKSVSELIMNEAHAGRPPAGKKLVRKLANTSYVSEDRGAIDRMLARFGLKSKERRTPWNNISPTQAIKILKAAGKVFRKGTTERLPGNTILVDLSDKRDAIVTDAEKTKLAGAALEEMRGSTPE